MRLIGAQVEGGAIENPAKAGIRARFRRQIGGNYGLCAGSMLKYR